MRNYESERGRESADSEGRLTPAQKAAKIYFWKSFEFSQGRPTLQLRIFDWHAKKGYLDTLEFPKEMPDYIETVVPPKRHFVVPEYSRQDQLIARYKDLRKRLDKKVQVYPDDVLLFEMGELILEKESQFQLLGRAGRPEVTEGIHVTPDSPVDPYASQLRKYVINGARTGMEAYDDMFQALGMYLAQDIAVASAATDMTPLDNRQRELYALRKKWEEHHPDERFATTEAVANLVQKAESKLIEEEPQVIFDDETIAAAEMRKPPQDKAGPSEEKAK